MKGNPSQLLSEFASDLSIDDVPRDVIERAQWLFLDWIGSAVAGSGSRSAKVFRDFAEMMGPGDGRSSLFGSAVRSSPYFAAMANGAASHVVEQDDLHNGSILHPATVVFPPLFAVAQDNAEISGKEFLCAAVAGYECGIRVGEFLGRSHYRVFHMTATAGTVAAAMATGRLLGLDRKQMLNALGSAGTQAGGLWEFLRDAADSKQLHTAKASADGLLAAFSAQLGLTGARQILEGEQGMAKGMLGDGDAGRLIHKLGSRWALAETSFKYHASCRHTHPAADALLNICQTHDLDYREIDRIDAYVYQAASDVLGAVDLPETIHQSKFSMGFVLALIARNRSAGVADFTEQSLSDPILADLRQRVRTIVDGEIDSQYPEKWGSRVEVQLKSGKALCDFVDTPKGDPDNMLTRSELETKARNLAEYSGVMSKVEMDSVIQAVWNLPESDSVAAAFPDFLK